MVAALRLVALLIATLASLSAAAGTIYPPVRAPAELVFPRDFGAHPQYRSEWWYLTGWLNDAANMPAGFQLSFFRVRPGLQEDNPSSFAPRQLILAHAAVSDPSLGRLRSAERSARQGFGLAGAESGDTRVAIDDWSLRREGMTYVARVRSAAFAYELTATAEAAPLLQGEAGFSRKDADPRHASYYYSRPQLAVRGWIELDGRRRVVSGRAWLDHEWSSEMLPERAVGWDWLGVNLNDGGALMAFRIRDATGATWWAGGSLQQPGRAPRALGPADFALTPLRRWRSPRSGAAYPVEMAVQAGDLKLHLVPLLDDQELDARRTTGAVYWDGAVRALDADQRQLGQGYLELTGYAGRFRLK